MTELYHGPWDPVKGDQPKPKVQYGDDYHPIYPDTETTGVLSVPLSAAFKFRTFEVAGYDCTQPKGSPNGSR